MAKFRKVLLFSASLLFLLSCASVPLNANPQSQDVPYLTAKNETGISEQKTGPEPAREAAGPSKTAIEKTVMPVESPVREVVPEQKSRKEGFRKESPAKGKTESPGIGATSKTQISDDLQEQQETLEQALELLNQSRNFWQQSDIDNALRCLDEAYALILEVNGDPEIARQKDDLRLIISKRIVEISTSRYTVTKGKMSEIPMIMNADVEREIRSFQTVERGFFIRSYQRSGQFRPVILKYLEAAGLPKELSWLPLVESGFQCNALSRARALGLWQFIPSTGYKFALNRDRWVDERLDVDKSTKAAIAYLKELHGIFGDWLTCLAAYNCGEGRVLRVISKQHLNYLDHFWDLYRQLPNETARYVPRFLATLHIIKDPKKYGMDLNEDLDKPIPYESVKTEKCMRLQDISQHTNISREALTALNSELKLQMTPDGPYDFKVPVGSSKLLLAAVDDIPKWEAPRQVSGGKRGAVLVRHKVKKGDSLKGIARRYKTTIHEIDEYNDLSGRLRVGQILKVPTRGYAKKARSEQAEKVKGKIKGKKKANQDDDASEKIITYKVKKGDTIVSLSRKYGITTNEIRKLNGITGSKLNVNQVIKIRDNS